MNRLLPTVRWARCMATAALVSLTALSHAGAPQVKGQAPGWFRLMVGDIEVTAINDGTVGLPVDQLLTNTQPGQVVRALQAAYLKLPLETSVNGYLINTGSKLVLVDTGAAKLFGPTLGNLIANLKASGYTPEQVDEIYITHMHADHVGGLMAGEQLAFPNAVVRAAKAEADFWLSEANMNAAPESARGFFKGAMASVGPYVKAGKFKAIEADGELVPGVRAIAARGHTPGHTIYAVESKGEKLVVWGDLMHVAAVQFADPSVTIQFDSDSSAAAPQRQKAYDDAAKNGYYAAVAHVSFPGIGRLRADGKGYTWLPANYTTNAVPAPAAQ